MKELSLPFDMLPSQQGNHRDNIYLMNYQSHSISFKTRISLKYHLFSFLLEGKKSVFCTGGNVEINPSEFLLLSSGNCLMSEQLATEKGLYKSILLFFDNKILAEFFTKHPLLHTDPKIEDNAASPFLIFKIDAFLSNYISSLGLMLSSGHQLTREMQGLKLEELLLYINNKYPGYIIKLRNASKEVDTDTEIRQAVNANIESNITVAELAFLCNTSLSTFKRRFATIYGTSPNKWLLQKRMEIAADMLKRKECKASDIYYQLGYENLSSFIQSFKQVHGVTPKKYQILN